MVGLESVVCTIGLWFGECVWKVGEFGEVRVGVDRDVGAISSVSRFRLSF